MPIFVVLQKVPNESLGKRIKDAFEDENLFQLSDSQWLVSAEMTTKQLTEKIGILEDPHLRSVVVFSIGNYYGRYSPDLWEWLKVKMEKVS